MTGFHRVQYVIDVSCIVPAVSEKHFLPVMDPRGNFEVTFTAVKASNSEA